MAEAEHKDTPMAPPRRPWLGIVGLALAFAPWVGYGTAIAILQPG